MGGRFHLFPMWQGWGRMHSVTAGGDFVLFVSMQPRPGRSGISHVVGTGVLCTPRGETFNLRLGGDFEKHMGASTDGKHASFYLHQRPGFVSGATGPPHLEFIGAWHNPDVVLDDHASLSREFQPDGRLYSGNPHRRPAGREVISLVLHEGSRAEFDAACKAAKSH